MSEATLPGEWAALAGTSGSWDWDIVANTLRIDAPFADLYGLSPHQVGTALPPAMFFSRIHPEDRTRMRVAVAGSLGGSETFSKEFRVQAADGTIRWMHGRGQTFVGKTDQPVRFTGLLIDVTERKRTEERLRIAQKAGGIGTFEYADGFATVTVSGEFCRLLGLFPAQTLPVRTINNLVMGNNLVTGDCHQLIPQRIEDSDTDLKGEFHIMRGDTGQARWIARRGEIVREDAGGYRLIGVIYDVTSAKAAETRLLELNETLEARVQAEIEERMQAEEALRQVQKMDAIGQLTGGIAHDFNNMLQGVTGSLEVALRHLDRGRTTDIARFLKVAQDAARRAGALTQRLLAFARRQRLNPRPIDADQLLTGLHELIDRTMGPGIHVEFRIGNPDGDILCDPNELESALLNLCINARDAMPGGGHLTIGATGTTLSAAQAAEYEGASPGDFVAIWVRDSGTGMSPDVLSRVFEPFFTTKPIGQGTGLGLSQVYGFVRQSGGFVHVESEPGNGTTVRLFLPRHPHQDDPALARPAQPHEQAGTGETVLLVDDEQLVRQTVAEHLRDLAYRVLEAEDGASAIEILQANHHLDLLITDVGLPNGMNGRQLAEAIRERRPSLPVLYITGYSGSVLPPGVEVIGKPFELDALARRVRDMVRPHQAGQQAGRPVQAAGSAA